MAIFGTRVLPPKDLLLTFILCPSWFCEPWILCYVNHWSLAHSAWWPTQKPQIFMECPDPMNVPTSSWESLLESALARQCTAWHQPSLPARGSGCPGLSMSTHRLACCGISWHSSLSWTFYLALQRLEPRPLSLSGKCPTTELSPQPPLSFFD